MPMYHEYNDCWQQHFQQMAQVAATKPKTIAGRMHGTDKQVMPFDSMTSSIIASIVFATALIAITL